MGWPSRAAVKQCVFNSILHWDTPFHVVSPFDLRPLPSGFILLSLAQLVKFECTVSKRYSH